MKRLLSLVFLLVFGATAVVAGGPPAIPPSAPVSLASSLESPLDQVSSPYAVYGARRLVSSYSGPLYQITRESDLSTLDVYAPRAAIDGWPNSARIGAWLAGSPGLISRVYDESGAGRHITISTVAQMPLWTVTDGRGVWDFDGVANYIDATSALSAFANGASGVTVAALRAYDTTLTSAAQPIFYASSGSGSTRLIMGLNNGAIEAGGRRLDTDAFAQTTGLPIDTGWDVEIARFDFTNAKLTHQVNWAMDVKTPFQTTGATSATASTMVYIGMQGASYFNGKIAALILSANIMTDYEVSGLIAGFASSRTISTTTSHFLRWGAGAVAMRGPYTAIPSAVTTTVITPDGTTPTDGVLASHRYHHHVRVASMPGRLWVAFSSGLNGEDGRGQIAAVSSSTNGGANFGAPLVAAQADAMVGGAGGRLVWPRQFVKNGGRLYLVSSIQDSTVTALALVATECKADGTVGAPFLISTEPYTPLSGYPVGAYDPAVSPLLFGSANVFGPNGGAWPGATQPSSWVGTTQFPGFPATGLFIEPVTLATDSTGQRLQRLWRKFGTWSSNRLTLYWGQESTDAGKTWGPLTPTDIPNEPSNGAGILLPDGRIGLVHNPLDQSSYRDTLTLSIFRTDGSLQSVYAVRSGVQPNPVYAGSAKLGGPSYPGVDYDGTNLIIGYSTQKEVIQVTIFPYAALAQ
ncbi:hypothetical protein CCR94_16250 [Rhodoblastus sphagnicola]|uniref:Sialidase domain-containing protein n=1 Tax=Rhodoblastus sphagnicola TaxID=333368 RepID=A0A2S6N2U4_9HYPH|nr:exo-alpha-sialidase [Rhodoblastus sphagnicola]MBB4199045.1 hypothetical protein [Rhodoblastus sphagnicola]PPQ28941.1 hypothetical protein CCR94_16250 [Rhodoblastus sphagnicola]